jgi:hypothetical protein
LELGLLDSIGWRMLPVHFGAWQTVYAWFRELARRFLFQTIHDVALMLDRTFGWMTRWRRLVRDYEQRIDVSEAMILVAMGGNLIRRNVHPRISKRALTATGPPEPLRVGCLHASPRNSFGAPGFYLRSPPNLPRRLSLDRNIGTRYCDGLSAGTCFTAENLTANTFAVFQRTRGAVFFALEVAPVGSALRGWAEEGACLPRPGEDARILRFAAPSWAAQACPSPANSFPRIRDDEAHRSQAQDRPPDGPEYLGPSEEPGQPA